MRSPHEENALLQETVGAPLHLTSISLQNIRCHSQFSWQCSPGINLITGPNGCGKTSILEAVSLVSTGRSFRGWKDPHVIQNSQASCSITTKWQRYGPMYASLQGKNGKFNVDLQGQRVKNRLDTYRNLPIVVDAPQGKRLVEGEMNIRRRWLDAMAAIQYPDYVEQYRRYIRCLGQLARLRRQKSTHMSPWDEMVVKYGQKVHQYRQNTLSCMQEYLAQSPILSGNVSLEMECTAPESSEAWLDKLRSQMKGGPSVWFSGIGPQCDRIHIRVNGFEIKQTGSHGQQRWVSIGFKLIEWQWIYDHFHTTPVILLDDGIDAFDRERQGVLFDILRETQAQVLMTSPVKPDFAMNADISCYHFSKKNMGATI